MNIWVCVEMAFPPSAPSARQCATPHSKIKWLSSQTQTQTQSQFWCIQRFELKMIAWENLFTAFSHPDLECNFIRLGSRCTRGKYYGGNDFWTWIQKHTYICGTLIAMEMRTDESNQQIHLNTILKYPKKNSLSLYLVRSLAHSRACSHVPCMLNGRVGVALYIRC